MPKTELSNLLRELRDHLDTDDAPISAEDRALLMRVHTDIEETLELTSEVPAERAAQTHSLLADAERAMTTHPVGIAIRRMSALLAGMGI